MGKHKYALLSSSSVHSPPSLFFHSHFTFSALVLFQCLAVHPVPALTFIFLCIPLLGKEHTGSPFWGLSGHLSRIISYPERPGLPHLPRMNNRIQPDYFIYYLQTRVIYLILCEVAHGTSSLLSLPGRRAHYSTMSSSCLPKKLKQSDH